MHPGSWQGPEEWLNIDLNPPEKLKTTLKLTTSCASKAGEDANTGHGDLDSEGIHADSREQS